MAGTRLGLSPSTSRRILTGSEAIGASNTRGARANANPASEAHPTTAARGPRFPPTAAAVDEPP